MTGQDSNNADPRVRSGVEGFAEVLSAARQQAGDPSFRKMAGRSGCISHTTLHEATKGYRFPSWSTTAEFAKAIGRDPADFRQQWEQVDRLVNPPEPEFRAHEEPAAEPEPREAPATVERESTGSTRAAAQPTGPSRAWAMPVALVGLVVLAAALVTVFVMHRDTAAAGAGPSSARSSTRPTQAMATGIPSTPGATAPSAPTVGSSCPAMDTRQDVPPLVAGDHAFFAKDVTYSDCSHVRPGQQFVKEFDLKNTGDVMWSGRTIVRSDLPLTKNSCRTAVSTPIQDTAPGGVARIEVKVTAPKKPGLCVVRWMMADHGRWSFPGQKPFKAQVVVTPK
ncbi:MAG TPA: NBR1-Ig-like domain-containing protein [Flexivirga sp.]|uniref:NBR1-Ig-like domain-containing protein n=1 Tax=Flexivirga sp. TaxID=1962927 RepID=UPI002BACF515|nr:NBR1-Ig-like domain-containing protein [Flexivirga sp.]HWC23027.1 NBR1-Ig-like domain-containing protein [Flexivirga sp.]